MKQEISVTLSKTDVPLGAALVCNLANEAINWGERTQLPLNSLVILTSSSAISRHVARMYPSLDLYPSNILHRTETDHWLTLSNGPLGIKQDISVLQQLNNALAPSQFLTAGKLTIADLELFGSLHKSPEWQEMMDKKSCPPHVLRWYNLIRSKVDSILSSLPPEVQSAITVKSTTVNGNVSSKREEEGKYVDLPGAKMGEVVVRFPPEASGYLHIGHAKAALLNQYYQKAFKGKLVMRFDDTNPDKEKADFEKVIIEDVKLLEIEPDMFTFTSDYFDQMLEMCESLIKSGEAYADDTDAETMKKEREERKESKNRNNSVEQNLKMWNEMKCGSEFGQKCCIRAKIDMNSPNGCLRDPTIYRCKNEPHLRTGNKFKVYPTYDFACPIVDSVEGITHVLRTTEYHDRDDQYFWFIEKLGLRNMHLYEYSRLNMNNTVLSKRKLTWFVEQGLVDGWDDPRFPTVRGIIRRGMTIEGLKDFIVAQGSSRSVVNMEWDKIWAFNKKVIDREAPRYTALQGDLIPVTVVGSQEELKEAQKHPKDSSKGMKSFYVGPKVYIEAVDAEQLKEGENATFINWGNLKILKVIRKDGKLERIEAETNLSNTDFKKTLKLTWLAETSKAPWTPVVCSYFDHIITKSVLGKDEDFKSFVNKSTRSDLQMVGDYELRNLKTGDIIQIQRKGFFRVDKTYKTFSVASCKESPVVLFYIPDGHTKEQVSATAKKETMSEKEKKQSQKGKKAEKSPQDESKSLASDIKVAEIHQKVIEQGNKIRKLKNDKADKTVIMTEVDVLKALKADFKTCTGVEWTPDIDINRFAASNETKSSSPVSNDVSDLHNKIKEQGDKIRILKSDKADKTVIMTEVDVLKALKADFKTCSGIDWTPDIDINKFSASNDAKSDTKSSSPVSNDILDLHNKIKEQGDKIRKLKSDKANKTVMTEVDVLKALKADFKTCSGIDWIPDIDINKFSTSNDTKSSSPVSNDALDLHNKIKEQGDKIRKLKSDKADKTVIMAEVDVLKALKAEFKNCTGVEWTPDIDINKHSASNDTKSETKTSSPVSNDALDIHNKIKEQGDKIRKLKSDKADKTVIMTEVDVLKALKADFKACSGIEWTPDIDINKLAASNDTKSETKTSCPVSNDASDLLNKIKEQGDKIRKLKSDKADKTVIMTEVDVLKALKADFKTFTGIDWTQDIDISKFAASNDIKSGIKSSSPVSNDVLDLHRKIKEQGDKIRKLKSDKAEKTVIMTEVDVLKALKAEFMTSAGIEWTPDVDISKFSTSNDAVSSCPVSNANEALDLHNKIKEQGDIVRSLKSQKAEKSAINAAVETLLSLKKEFKNKTNIDWKPDIDPSSFDSTSTSTSHTKRSKDSSPSSKQVDSSKSAKKAKIEPKVEDKLGKKQTRLGLEAKKKENLPDWYSQVITKSEMIEYYNVSGCYILRPWSYSIWEIIKDFFDKEIKKLGVENGYFPIFVSKDALEKEKTHIADFSPEVAWVTRSGSSDMAEPVAIRPTSETVMYPAYAKWIQSHRDLPLRINQWNNVVRWEFKQPTPFLRTREFLWQEGHTAFATKEEACEEVYTILELYARIYEELLAIPVVRGHKTKKEQFAGGDFTTTTEAYISASGRAIQGATSHHLGQNFSKMFEIVFDDPKTQEKKFVYQNSWGLTTRTIGVMVMVHGDDKGLVLPPRVAPIQVVVMPVGITASSTDEVKQSLTNYCTEVEKELSSKDIKTRCDFRDNITPAWKFNHWELKGVPLRIEVGPRELSENKVFAVRRDTGEKQSLDRAFIERRVYNLLETIQKDMFDKARDELLTHKTKVHKWQDLLDNLDKGNLILAPFCGIEECEDEIKKNSAREEASEVGAPSMGAKGLCIPFEQPDKVDKLKCINPYCSKNPKFYTLFGRSY